MQVMDEMYELINEIARNRQRNPRINFEMEHEANTFANALLIPANVLATSIRKMCPEFVSGETGMCEEHVYELASYFRVNPMSMLHRLIDVGLISTRWHIVKETS